LPDFSYSNLPHGQKNYHTMYQCGIFTTQCTKWQWIFHSKALQNIPKLVFLVWKYTIWQLWLQSVRWSQSASTLHFLLFLFWPIGECSPSLILVPEANVMIFSIFMLKKLVKNWRFQLKFLLFRQTKIIITLV
jgi:hypothetical protein